MSARVKNAGIVEPTSASSGVIGGLIATGAGLPLSGLAFAIASVAELTLLHKVMHVQVEYRSQLHGGTALLVKAVVSGATGLIAGTLAAMLALFLMRRAHRATFACVTAAGYGLIAAIYWLALSHRFTQSVGWFGSNAAIGWLAALFGLAIAMSMESAKR